MAPINWRELLRQGVTTQEAARTILANLCADYEWGEKALPLAAAIDALREGARADERESCAKIADDDDGNFTWAGTDEGVKMRQQVAREIAAAIRARTIPPSAGQADGDDGAVLRRTRGSLGAAHTLDC